MIQQRRTGRQPFRGELMTCVVCGATERAGPGMSSNWRAVDIDDERFYACPRELPPDGASAKAYKKAYRRLLNHCKRAMFERDAYAELLIVTRQAWADLKRNRDLYQILLTKAPDAEVLIVMHGEFCGVHAVEEYGDDVWIAADEPFPVEDGPVPYGLEPEPEETNDTAGDVR